MKYTVTHTKILSLALVLLFGISYVSAWTGPTAEAPNANTPPPINVSATAQTKAGDFGIIAGKAFKYATNTDGTGGVDIAKAQAALNNFFFGNSGKMTATGTANTALGSLSTLGALSSGTLNTAVGSASLSLNTTGSANTSVGANALKSNISGSANTAIGEGALQVNVGSISSYNPAGYNTAIGSGAMSGNTSGNHNVAVGANTSAGGSFNTVIGSTAIGGGDNSTVIGYGAGGSGSDLVALGVNSGKSTGWSNTAVGKNALSGSGSDNTAVGTGALSLNTTGANNTAVGSAAMFGQNVTNGGTASENTAVGKSALASLSRGTGNTAIGRSALSTTQGNFNIVGSASNNTAVGYGALTSNTTGKSNTALGVNANVAEGNLTNATAIGAGAVVTTNNEIMLGNSDVTKVRTFGSVLSGRTVAATMWFDCGGVGAGGACYRVPSDFRLKENIVESPLGLDFILTLKPVTFDYKNGGRAVTGLIAQDVEKALAGKTFSGLQKPNEFNKYYSIDYSSFVIPLIKATQEQQKEIDELKAQNDALEARLKIIEEKLK